MVDMSKPPPATKNCLVLNGEWDLERKEELTRLLGALIPGEPATIELSGVTYADSTFLSVLANFAVKFGPTKITLHKPHPHILKVLQIGKFDAIFNIVEGSP